MLKTSSTKSAKPRKGVVRVGDSDRNRAKLVSKHKVDEDEVGGGEVNDKVDDEVYDEVEKNQNTSKSK